MLVVVLLLQQCSSYNYSGAVIRIIAVHAELESELQLQYKDLLRTLRLFASLKVLSNGAGGGWRVVSIDPFL